MCRQNKMLRLMARGLGNRATEEASGCRGGVSTRCGKDVGNPTYVCALGHRHGPGGWRRWGSPLPPSRLLRRADLTPRCSNSVRMVVGDRLVWGGPQLEGRTPPCPWLEPPTASITGFVGVSTQPIFPQLNSALHPMPIADRGEMVLLKAS